MIIGILGVAGSGKDTAGKLMVEQHGCYSMAFADALKVFCQWMFGWTAEQLWGPSSARNALDESLSLYQCSACGYFSRALQDEIAESAPEDDILCPSCYEFTLASAWLTALSPRFALQHLGTEWARTLKQDAHIDFTLSRIRSVQCAGPTRDPLWSVLPTEVLQQRLIPALHHGNPSVFISDCRFKNEVERIQAEGGRVFRIVRDSCEDTTTTGIAGHASEAEQLNIPDSSLDGIIDNNGTLTQLQTQLRTLL